MRDSAWDEADELSRSAEPRRLDYSTDRCRVPQGQGEPREGAEVADIVLTAAERHRIGEISSELDPATHELTSHFSDVLPGDDWAFVVETIRAELKTVLEMGLVARAVAGFATSEQIADEAGVEHLLEDCGALWEIANFGACFEDNRAERWVRICSTTRRIVDNEGRSKGNALAAAAFALRDLAYQMMFEPLDEELVQMLTYAERGD